MTITHNATIPPASGFPMSGGSGALYTGSAAMPIGGAHDSVLTATRGVNFYKHYLGDYARDTMGLSMVEDGAYLRLLHTYYATLSPIPADEQRYRIARAYTDEERRAVDFVLSRFFIRIDDEFHQERADREIALWRARAENNREIGKLGGRPKKTESVTEWVSEQKPNGLSVGSVLETHKEPYPEARSQKPEARDQNPDFFKTCSAGALVLAPDGDEAADEHAKACPYQKIVDLYHEVLPELARVKLLPENRKRAIRARWRNEAGTLDEWRWLFQKVRDSPFLMGKVPGRDGRPPFTASFDWIVNPTNFVAIAEGKYAAKKTAR